MIRAVLNVTSCAALTLALGGGVADAQEVPTAPAEKESWKAPFGGTFTAGFTVLNDYSYRGISQTMHDIAIQPSLGYETRTLSANLPISAYVGAWGSNVNYPGTGTTAEIDLLAGFRTKTLGDKLSLDLGYIRYNYLSAPSALFYDFNEFGLVATYDFGVATLGGAVRYSPNFFANSGIAWYKQATVAVPMPFIKVNENVSFKAFASLGNQYVERYANYAIGADNYWDWQIGLTVTVYGIDLTAAYTDTSLDVQNCGNTYNCQGRVIVSVGKTF